MESGRQDARARCAWAGQEDSWWTARLRSMCALERWRNGFCYKTTSSLRPPPVSVFLVGRLCSGLTRRYSFVVLLDRSLFSACTSRILFLFTYRSHHESGAQSRETAPAPFYKTPSTSTPPPLSLFLVGRLGRRRRLPRVNPRKAAAWVNP